MFLNRHRVRWRWHLCSRTWRSSWCKSTGSCKRWFCGNKRSCVSSRSSSTWAAHSPLRHLCRLQVCCDQFHCSTWGSGFFGVCCCVQDGRNVAVTPRLHLVNSMHRPILATVASQWDVKHSHDVGTDRASGPVVFEQPRTGWQQPNREPTNSRSCKAVDTKASPAPTIDRCRSEERTWTDMQIMEGLSRKVSLVFIRRNGFQIPTWVSQILSSVVIVRCPFREEHF